MKADKNRDNNTIPVSVIIPTYNRADMLKRAVVSVLKQSYQNFEIIVVDDNSHDNTKDVVNNFDDTKISYIKNKTNLGASAGRNIGIKKAKYDHIAFLDDDDEWLPKKIEKQVRLLSSLPKDYCGVYCGIARYKNGVQISVQNPIYEGDIFEELLYENHIGSTSCVLVKKSALVDVGGFNEDLPASQDLELYLRLAEKYKFKAVKKILLKYHLHDNEQIKDDLRAYLQAKKYVYKKYKEDITKDKRIWSVNLYQIAIVELLLGKKKRAKKLVNKAWHIDPTNLKHLSVLILLSICPRLYLMVRNWYSKE